MLRVSEAKEEKPFLGCREFLRCTHADVLGRPIFLVHVGTNYLGRQGSSVVTAVGKAFPDPT
jgi:hypothetical protein